MEAKLPTDAQLWRALRPAVTKDDPDLQDPGCSAGCFFFSSRRRHTRLQGDWSSDVCSSDLEMRLAGDTFHEIPIPPNLFDDNGVLTIDFINRNDTALLFTLKEGMEVLYREIGRASCRERV